MSDENNLGIIPLQGVLSLDGILTETIAYRSLRQAVVKDADGFDKLVSSLQAALTRAFDDGLRKGIVRALDRLKELDPGTFTEADGELITRALEQQVGEEALAAAVRGPVLNLSEALYRLGAVEVGTAAGIDIRFGRPDLAALDILGTGNLYWVGNSWNTYTLNTIQSILGDYFREGMTRESLTERFAKDFAALGERSRHYWEVLADHTATKTREIGRVTGYEQAGAEYVQVRAHLDARTTPICRHMNGRIIAVHELRTQTDEYLKASATRNVEAAKAAWTMHGAKDSLADTHTADLPKGTASPPYHFRCRTITVMWFAPAEPSRLEHGQASPQADRQAVDALMPDEHKNRMLGMRADAQAMPYAADDWKDDIRKAAVAKHMQEDFGLSEEKDYLALARQIVAEAKRTFVGPWKEDGLRYYFYAAELKGYAVVDESLQLRGCFGHPKPGGIEKCLQYQLLPYLTEII